VFIDVNICVRVYGVNVVLKLFKIKSISFFEFGIILCMFLKTPIG